MHNGAIHDFRHTAMHPLRDKTYAGLLGTTDSKTIFAVLLDHLKENGGDLAEALQETTRFVLNVCRELGAYAP